MNKNTNGNTKNGIDQNNEKTMNGIVSISTKKDRPQNKNLKPFNKTDNILSREEAERRGRNGGVKSGEIRRARKTMKETILAMMAQELDPVKLESMGVDTSTLNGDYTMQNAVISAMFREALNGDTKAAQLLRDTIDEAPTTRQEVRQEIISKDDLKTIDNLKQYLTG
jgi:hypothetical protein